MENQQSSSVDENEDMILQDEHLSKEEQSELVDDYELEKERLELYLSEKAEVDAKVAKQQAKVDALTLEVEAKVEKRDPLREYHDAMAKLGQ